MNHDWITICEDDNQNAYSDGGGNSPSMTQDCPRHFQYHQISHLGRQSVRDHNSFYRKQYSSFPFILFLFSSFDDDDVIDAKSRQRTVDRIRRNEEVFVQVRDVMWESVKMDLKQIQILFISRQLLVFESNVTLSNNVKKGQRSSE